MNALHELNEKLAKQMVSLQELNGVFRDPVEKIERTRAASEIAKSYLEMDNAEPAEKAFGFVLKKQNSNGSWNEVHLDLNEEGTVETSIIGLNLLKAFEKTGNKDYLNSAKRAGEYILSKEISPGYFIKTAYHYSNILNANANCAAFLSRLHDHTKDKKFFDARERAIFNVVKWQFKSGALPYSSPEKTHPYLMHNNIRDFHYHSLTLYYLLQADPKLQNRYCEIACQKGVDWLEKNLTKTGFNWEKNQLIFTIGSTAAYAYAAYVFKAFKKEHAVEICINRLKSLQTQQGFSRYEKTGLLTASRGAIRDLLDLKLGEQLNYSIIERGYQVRERIKKELLQDHPFSLYYSAQILDALTETEKLVEGK